MYSKSINVKQDIFIFKFSIPDKTLPQTLQQQ